MDLANQWYNLDFGSSLEKANHSGILYGKNEITDHTQTFENSKTLIPSRVWTKFKIPDPTNSLDASHTQRARENF